MSAIDSLSHAHVAHFCNIPVYWVLEEKPMDYLTDSPNDKNKKINQFNLSIGGGSGEHPALVLNNDAIVFDFLSNIEEYSEEEQKVSEIDNEVYALAQEVINKFYEENIAEITDWRLDQNHWCIENFIKVNKVLKKDIYGKSSVINKIKDAMALFILFEMPLDHCLKNKDLLEIAKKIRELKFFKVDHEVMSLSNTLSGVLNFQKYGKIIRNNNVVWGYSLSDWKKDNIQEV